MSPDPMIRVLLGLILACLVILVIQGFGSDVRTNFLTLKPLTAPEVKRMAELVAGGTLKS